jgi:hypothetical protein
MRRQQFSVYYSVTKKKTLYTKHSTVCGLGEKRYRFLYRGADKPLARPTSRCILFEGENILFDASLVLYI